MSIRRRAVALGAVSLGLVALAGCEKPTPLATVTVGSHSASTEATRQCRDSKGISQSQASACLTATPKKTITVHAGDKIRIGVDTNIAHKGWFALAGQSQLTGNTLLKDKTYWSADSSSVFSQQDQTTGATTTKQSVVLAVVEMTGNQKILGVWTFKLKNGDA
jgi:hypothetical protein